jgi:hypothetical protein
MGSSVSCDRATGCRVVRDHCFPLRFLPLGLPEVAHRFLDRRFGTMAYFEFVKADPVTGSPMRH